MKQNNQFVVFSLDEHQFALNLSAVERIVRVVHITPIPDAPRTILGIINIAGKVIPVFDIRKKFNLPGKEIELDDHLIIARASKHTVSLLVDMTKGVIDSTKNKITSSSEILPSIKNIDGVISLNDNMIFIQNLDKFLSIEEENVILNNMEQI